MIVYIIIRTCPECASENIVRNGHDYKGTQKYHCHDCGANGSLDKNRIDEITKQQATDCTSSKHIGQIRVKNRGEIR